MSKGLSVYKLEEEAGKVALEKAGFVSTPAVFRAPIRDDVVRFVHTQIRCNKRQPHGVKKLAGVQCSAASWGTGRAVARIPRVRGGGTHRSGQAAYGNMCRGGHTFNPLVTYRKWHRKVNLKQKRYATASAIAASAIPALVSARGHVIDKVEQFPVVVDEHSGVLASLDKTKSAVAILKALGAYDDVLRCKSSKKIRPGKGKMRNRRYVMKRGPLIVHTHSRDSKFVLAMRNVPGVELMHVRRMNLLKLAPGGHLGRFIIWTKDAVQDLANLFASKADSTGAFAVPVRNLGDISELINSDAIQRALRPKLAKSVKAGKKINPLTNDHVMHFLNPYARVQKRKTILLHQKKVLSQASVSA